MNRNTRHFTFAVAAAFALLLPASFVLAQVPPQGDPVAARAYGPADLGIRNAHQPLSRLPAALVLRLQPQLDALGVPATAGFYDLRAGRWGTLLAAKPLPGQESETT